MTLKKIGFLSLGAISALVLSACGGRSDIERDDDETVYASVLGSFNNLATKAKAIDDDDKRFVAYAEAEAALLDSAVMVPTTTQGGTYAVTRVAPRTVPYSHWGNDEDRLKGLVLVKKNSTNEFITGAQRKAMLDEWAEAVAGTGTYDPVAYLESQGFEFSSDYVTTYSTAPVTLDILNTSEQSDTEVLVNCFDGLIEYNNLGELRGNLAVEDDQTGLPWTVSADGKTYTFNIRDDAYWFDASGKKGSKVTADDFVASFQHMLDAQAGLEFLVDGIVEGVSEYLYDGAAFSKVGIKAEGQKLTFKLDHKESYFPSRLTYSCFMPMNRAFFKSKGGEFGIQQFKEASTKTSYKYGNVSDPTNMLYNGAFRPGKIVNKSEIKITKNADYFNASSVRLNSVKWVFDAGENPTNTYNEARKGTYAGIGLGKASGLLDKAKSDKIFDKYNYVVDTTTTTYMAGLNLNRGTWVTGSIVSTQNKTEETLTRAALRNKNFRKALLHSWNRANWNAVTTGDELKTNSLRNMYTQPEFLTLSKDVTSGDHTFKKGETYGELVQYFCDKLNMGIKVEDGQDGWFNASKAKELIKKAKSELGEAWADGVKVALDVTYYGASTSQTAQAESFKSLVEGVLGEYVEVRLNNAETTEDFYAAGYRASTGAEGNFDVFYGSGWGPDYGDPSTYLDTFTSGGYMNKIIGLF